MKVSLGFKPDHYYGGAVAAPSEEKDEKEIPTIFPSFMLHGKAAKKLSKGCNVGDTVTATVTFRVTELSKNAERQTEYSENKEGVRMEVELHSIETDKADDDEPDETAEDAVDGYVKGLKK